MKWFIIRDTNDDNKQKIIKVENHLENDFRNDIEASNKKILSEGDSMQEAFIKFSELINNL